MAKNLLATFAGAAALLALAAPAIAGTVVASSGPSAAQFRVGSQIANTQRITLREGDAVTVLDDGGTRVLRGPGTFVLARQSAAAGNNAFAALTAQRRAGQARAGAVRNTQAGEQVTNPNIWYVDVARSGTVCVNDPTNVRLWRADTAAAAELAITGAGGETMQVTFPEREMLARLGGEQPVREGVPYSIGGASEVTFKFLSDVPEDAEGLAQTLIQNGCMVQIEQLATATMES